MAIPENCFLTGLTATISQPDNGKTTWVVDSPACGIYEISHTAANQIRLKYPDSLHILAAIARRHSDNDGRLELHTGNVQDLLDAVNVPDGPLEQIDEIVKYIRKKARHFGDQVLIARADYPVAFGRNESEFVSLLREAE